jgi:hypothetical protein
MSYARRCFWSLILITAIASLRCTSHPNNPASIGTREPVGGVETTATSNGLVLRLGADKVQVNVGEDVEVTEELKNVTDHEIWANFRDFELRADELASYPPIEGLPAVPKTSDGYPFLKNSRPRPFLFDIHDAPGLPQAVITSKHFATCIPPGRTPLVMHRFKILRPGIYRFSATWKSSFSADRRAVLWKGELRSNPVDITVLPKAS